MENKRRALGKGLEELFNSEQLNISDVEEKIINNTPKDQIVNLNLDELRSNPYQPRKNFDEESLNELASSIKEHGVFQPIIAKKSIKGYEIIAGERRVKASRLAGLTTIPAIIKDFTDEEMMEIALLENLQRENLSAMEEAEAYNALKTRLNLTQEELAKKVGKSRSHITNMLGLLTLPNEIKDEVVKGELSMGHARVLSKLEDKEQAISLAEKTINENLSVRRLEELTNSKEEYHRKKEITPHKPKSKDSEYSYLESDLCEKLGTKVKIRNNKLDISFTNANDLTRILEIMHLDK